MAYGSLFFDVREEGFEKSRQINQLYSSFSRRERRLVERDVFIEWNDHKNTKICHTREISEEKQEFGHKK
jgi:hypothetical protein